VQGVEDPTLDGFETVIELGNGAVPDDVGGVLEKVTLEEAFEPGRGGH
jgi:hypothetical protein